MIASPRLDFIRRDRILAYFGAEHVFALPAMAHPAGLSLRPCEPAAATDHRIPDRTDRGPAGATPKKNDCGSTTTSVVYLP